MSTPTMMTSSALSRLLARHQIMLSVGAMVVLGLGALLILTFQFKTIESHLAAFPDSVMEMNLVGTESAYSSGAATDASLKASVRSMFHLATALGVALIAFGLLAAWRLVYTVTVPLRRLSEGAARLGAGNLAHRIEYAHDDEFGEVVRGFNRMSGQLQQSLMQLRESNAQQGQRIDERTRELFALASHDALTGLANRAKLHEFTNDTIKMSSRRGEKFALLLLDLDCFKDINDSLGHDQGDQLLRVVARRLQGQVREVDLTARLGGDEFCLLLVDVEDIQRAAEIAQRCLDALNAPIQLNGTMIRPRASIGITLYPDDAETPAGLLKAADTAMYAAKRAGKHRYALYETDMTQKVEQQLSLESALREAVERGEFELHYQPQIDLASGRMSGVEALIRWRPPGRGLVPPDEFISVAERIGLIDAIGVWVLETACHQAVAWHQAGMKDLVMAVNISPGHFGSSEFTDTVARVLLVTGITPSCLEIEVTESVTRDSLRHAAISDSLRRLGVRVAIDDFGTGYSSLGVLKKMPIDTLKLDRAFIRDMLDNAESSVIIGTLLGMAKGLNLTTVAEGVETLEQVQVLIGLGCPLAQGYYFSRPVTAGLIPALAQTDFFMRMAIEPSHASSPHGTA